MEQDKLALRASQAGMRFIAQTHIYNQANWQRLHTFISDSYKAELLEQEDTDARLAIFQNLYEQVGRQKVKQVLATHEHHVIVVTETEREGAFYYVEVQVEDDYPHQITAFMQQPLHEVAS